MTEAPHVLPDVRLVDNAYEAAEDVDALMVVTEWNEFRHLNMARIKESMAGDVLIDGRNIYNPDSMTSLGFRYAGVGRGPKHSNGG